MSRTLVSKLDKVITEAKRDLWRCVDREIILRQLKKQKAYKALVARLRLMGFYIPEDVR